MFCAIIISGERGVTSMKVNEAATYTVLSLAVATLGTVSGALFASTLSARVAFVALTAIASAVSYASMSAWYSLREHKIDDTHTEYFEALASHLQYTIAGVSQFIATGVVLAALRGATQGITNGSAQLIGNAIKSAM